MGINDAERNNFSNIKRYSNLNYFHEILIAGRFGLIGILSTLVHVSTIWLIFLFTNITPIVANTFAFLTAFSISFTGNYLWTFRSPGSPLRAIFRFFFIAINAFLVNTLVLNFLVYKGWFLPLTSAILSASLVPFITFLASRLWCFK